MSTKILYNVTINIDHDCHEEWVNWMKDVHLPDVMSTGKFIRYQFQRILEGQNETGVTYAIQYIAPNLKSYEEYIEKHAESLRAKFTNKYNGKFGAFRTLMEIIDESD